MHTKKHVEPSVTPACVLGHDFINNLSVILGECELLEAHAADPACARRLSIIKDTAQEMVRKLNSHRCTGAVIYRQ